VSRRFTAFLALLALPLAVCLAGANTAFASSTATVKATPSAQLGKDLGTLWATVFQTPSPQNPFGTGGPEDGCFAIGKNIVSPFGPTGVPSCTVAAGTTIFVAAASFECSTFENVAKPELRSCAIRNDAQSAPTVTVDGKPATVTETETGQRHSILPADNVFGLPAKTKGFFYGHGWVTLLSPLPSGTHTIAIANGGSTITTSITVQ
jgi:hypothetical protein